MMGGEGDKVLDVEVNENRPIGEMTGEANEVILFQTLLLGHASGSIRPIGGFLLYPGVFGRGDLEPPKSGVITTTSSGVTRHPQRGSRCWDCRSVARPVETSSGG